MRVCLVCDGVQTLLHALCVTTSVAVLLRWWAIESQSIGTQQRMLDRTTIDTH
jgi:hypothetical protein